MTVTVTFLNGRNSDICIWWTHGLSFIRVHPSDVIAFRKSRGIKAKSDPVDARLILAFLGDELSRRGWRSSVIGDDLLRALAARRRQLVEALQAERCRLALAAVPAVRHSLEVVITALRHNLDALEAEIAAATAGDHKTARLSELLQTIHGIGPITAATLIADLPELGLAERQANRRSCRLGAAHQAKRHDALPRTDRSWSRRSASSLV